MDPFALFNPAAYNPLDPQTLTGLIEPQRLLDTASVFPGGAIALVFALFWAPVGPGIPAGVLLARHAGINPVVTLGLYALSDVLGACVCHPWFSFLRRVGSRVPILRAIGQKLMKLALIGARPPRVEDLQRGVHGTFPALFRIGTIGFGLDVYHAGMVVAGLPIPRVAGWLAAIAGDLVWFAVLLATSIATATVTSDDRVIAVVMLVVMIVVPQLAKRYVPALRDPTPPTTSQLQQVTRDLEVHDQAGPIDDRHDQRAGHDRRVKTQPPQHKRQHRRNRAGPQHDARRR